MNDDIQTEVIGVDMRCDIIRRDTGYGHGPVKEFTPEEVAEYVAKLNKLEE